MKRRENAGQLRATGTVATVTASIRAKTPPTPARPTPALASGRASAPQRVLRYWPSQRHSQHREQLRQEKPPNKSPPRPARPSKRPSANSSGEDRRRPTTSAQPHTPSGTNECPLLGWQGKRRISCLAGILFTELLPKQRGTEKRASKMMANHSCETESKWATSTTEKTEANVRSSACRTMTSRRLPKGKSQ